VNFYNVGARLYALVVSAIVAFCFLAFGAALIFYFGPQLAQEAQRIGDLTELDAASFRAIPSDQDVLITGVLEGNRKRTSDGLVAYARECWDVEYDSEDGYEGSWETIETVLPELTVSVDGGQVRTVSVESATMGGHRHSQIVEYGDGKQKANGIPEGSIRVIGYKNEDQITIVGQKTKGRLLPDRLHGGDRAHLLQELETGLWFTSICGVGLILIAPAILLSALLGRVKASVSIGGGN